MYCRVIWYALCTILGISGLYNNMSAMARTDRQFINSLSGLEKALEPFVMVSPGKYETPRFDPYQLHIVPAVFYEYISRHCSNIAHNDTSIIHTGALQKELKNLLIDVIIADMNHNYCLNNTKNSDKIAGYYIKKKTCHASLEHYLMRRAYEKYENTEPYIDQEQSSEMQPLLLVKKKFLQLAGYVIDLVK